MYNIEVWRDIMLDFEYAKTVFLDFINQYDTNDASILQKKNHTLRVVENSDFLAKSLHLSEEDRELAKIIALFHDIGRFSQIKQFGNMHDYETLNHAELGAHILFEEGMISKFVEDRKYDSIIKKAILIHNQYQIPQEVFTERELLHIKMIRDADKMDSFYGKAIDDIYAISQVTKEEVENSTISEHIYECILNQKTIISKERVTPADIWVSYLAFVFDFNYSFSLIPILENDYINKIIDRFDYQIKDTKEKMENIRKLILEYVNDKVKPIQK